MLFENVALTIEIMPLAGHVVYEGDPTIARAFDHFKPDWFKIHGIGVGLTLEHGKLDALEELVKSLFDFQAKSSKKAFSITDIDLHSGSKKPLDEAQAAQVVSMLKALNVNQSASVQISCSCPLRICDKVVAGLVEAYHWGFGGLI